MNWRPMRTLHIWTNWPLLMHPHKNPVRRWPMLSVFQTAFELIWILIELSINLLISFLYLQNSGLPISGRVWFAQNSGVLVSPLWHTHTSWTKRKFISLSKVYSLILGLYLIKFNFLMNHLIPRPIMLVLNSFCTHHSFPFSTSLRRWLATNSQFKLFFLNFFQSLTGSSNQLRAMVDCLCACALVWLRARESRTHFEFSSSNCHRCRLCCECQATSGRGGGGGRRRREENSAGGGKADLNARSLAFSLISSRLISLSVRRSIWLSTLVSIEEIDLLWS